MLFVPGNSHALFDLLHDQHTAEFLADRGSRAGWVTSACNGSLLLGAAGLLRGYRAACFWYARDLLIQYGATPDSARVVIDRRFPSDHREASPLNLCGRIVPCLVYGRRVQSGGRPPRR